MRTIPSALKKYQTTTRVWLVAEEGSTKSHNKLTLIDFCGPIPPTTPNHTPNPGHFRRIDFYVRRVDVGLEFCSYQRAHVGSGCEIQRPNLGGKRS